MLCFPQTPSIKIQASDLPELRTDLVAALAALDVNELTHSSNCDSSSSDEFPFKQTEGFNPANRWFHSRGDGENAGKEIKRNTCCRFWVLEA